MADSFIPYQEPVSQWVLEVHKHSLGDAEWNCDSCVFAAGFRGSGFWVQGLGIRGLGFRAQGFEA